MLSVLLLSVSLFAENRTSISFWSGNFSETFPLTDEIQYPAYEGFELSRGINFKNLFFFATKFSIRDVFTEVVAEVGTNFPTEFEDNLYLHRFRGTTRFGFLTFSAGKDSLALGPALHNNLVVSRYVPPQKFVNLSLGKGRVWVLGEFFFSVGNIFVRDEQRRFPNPNFTFFAFEWSPPFARFFSAGAIRLIAWGGRGGFVPRSLGDVLDLLTARVENAIATCFEIEDEAERQRCIEYWRSRDTNQFVSVYLALDLSIFRRFFKFLADGLFYFEYSADDIMACWQVEDRGKISCFPLPVRFLSPARAIGGFLRFAQGISFLFEFSSVRRAHTYLHPNYPLVVGGRFLGHHAGGESLDVWSKVILGRERFFVSGGVHFVSRRDGRIFEFPLAFALDVSDAMTLSASVVPIFSGKFDIILSVFASQRFF